MVQPKGDDNDAIMQRRVAQREGKDDALHELPANREPAGAEMDQRNIPARDKVVGHTRWKRAPYAGEVPGHQTPPYDIIGVQALSPMLTHVEFPASSDDILAALGDVRIPISQREVRTVREMLDLIGGGSYQSAAQFEDAVARNWDRIANVQGRGGRGTERPRG